MKLRFPTTRYRVVRDNYLGYEAQFKVWWFPFWMECESYTGGCGTNTNRTIEEARQLCADHAEWRRQPVAQFSAHELESQQ